ncbi:unnamed protein product [Gongylonema pulchrum]|uniref:GlnD_UR_UTase domain-containing protein n=1 Tax=Gongylonema pulchrum TaxID=637853 RepID=A0A183ECC6_9BILA|nr:unnamed protein product [Gongylonema pulchrum]
MLFLLLKEVVVLFEKGMDREAERIIPVMENQGLLAFELFDVAVARVRKWFDLSEVDLMSRGLRLSLIDNRLMHCLRNSTKEVVTAPPDDILKLMRQVRMSLGTTLQPDDRSFQTDQLAVKFEGLIAALR